MKKEKTIRTYQRRTKTGKLVTVRQHTAKYDAAEALKEAAKKKGAGDELENLKKKGKYEVLGVDLSNMSDEDFKEFAGSYMDENDNPAPTTRAAFKKWAEKQNWGHEGKSLFKEGVAEFMKNGGAKGIGKGSSPKKSDSSYGFTPDEYKAWYHWDQDADPKNKSALKVEKALKKQMGTKAYNKYFDEMSDSYSARGHNKAFKGLSDTLSMGGDKKSVTSAKETKADSSEYGKVPKHLGMTQQEWNDWMDGGAGYKKADKKAKAHLEKLYGKEGAKLIRKKYEGDGSNKYIDLVSKATADKKVLSEIGGDSKKKSPKKSSLWQRDAEVQDEKDLASKRRAEAASAKDVKEWAKVNKYHLKKNGLYAKGLGKGTHSVEDLRKLMSSSENKSSSRQDKAAKDAGFSSYAEMKAHQDYSTAKNLLKKKSTKGDVRKQLEKEVSDYEKKSSKSKVSELSSERVGNGVAFKDNRAGRAWAEKNGEPVAPFGKEGRTYYKVGNDLYGNITGGHGGTIWGKVGASHAKRLIKLAEDDKKRKEGWRNPTVPTSTAERTKLYKMLTSKETKLWNVPMKYKGFFSAYGNPSSKGKSFIKEYEGSSKKGKKESSADLRKRADAMDASAARSASKASVKKLTEQGYTKYRYGGETFYHKGKSGSLGGSYKVIDSKGKIVTAYPAQKEYFKEKIAKVNGKTYKMKNVR